MSEPPKRKWNPEGMRYPRRLPVYDTEEGARLLEALAERWQVSKAGAIRRAIRDAAKREKVE